MSTRSPPSTSRLSDYLLKPVTEERLRRALEKVRQLQNKPDPAQLESLLSEIASRSRPERLAARFDSGIATLAP